MRQFCICQTTHGRGGLELLVSHFRKKQGPANGREGTVNGDADVALGASRACRAGRCVYRHLGGGHRTSSQHVRDEKGGSGGVIAGKPVTRRNGRAAPPSMAGRCSGYIGLAGRRNGCGLRAAR